MSDKLAALALCTWAGQLQPHEAGQILSPLLINEVAPLLEEEGTSWAEVEYYHYGFTRVLADCALGLHYKVLQYRHVRKILHDVWCKYVGYDIIQYAIATKLLDEVEGDSLLLLVREVMTANAKAAAEYKAGKEKAGGSLIGAVMKKQKVDPVAVKRLIRQELGLVD